MSLRVLRAASTLAFTDREGTRRASSLGVTACPPARVASWVRESWKAESACTTMLSASSTLACALTTSSLGMSCCLYFSSVMRRSSRLWARISFWRTLFSRAMKERQYRLSADARVLLTSARWSAWSALYCSRSCLSWSE